MRTIIAALVGAVLMFAWQSFAHTAIPLGHTGIQEIPNEGPALDALAQSLGGKDGLYFFPGFGLGHHPKPDEMKAGMAAYGEKLKTSPWGIVVYHPPGSGTTDMTRDLVGEFVIELIAVSIAAWLLLSAGISGFANRVAFFGAIGAISAIATNASYWNWYGFPLDYTLAYGFMQIVGFLLAGVGVALIAKKG